MKYTQKALGALSLLLTIALPVFSELPIERTGRGVQVEYLGSKTTEEMTRSTQEKAKFAAHPMSKNFAGLNQRSAKAPLSSSWTSRPAQTVGFNFTSATVADSPNLNSIPPNLNGWVGEQQYVMVIYQAIRSYNKYTGEPDGILDTEANSFFGFPANDVRLDYDRFYKRWYLAAENVTIDGDIPDLILAVSGECSGVIKRCTKWDFYRVLRAQVIPDAPLDGFLDYQQLAVDEKAVYISVDTFDFDENFLGNSVVVFEKKSLLAGDPIVTVFPGLLPNTVLPPLYNEFAPPADNFDKNPQYGYVVQTSNLAYPGPIYNEFYLYRILNPGSRHPTIAGPIVIPVPNYTDPQNIPHLGNLYPGTDGLLQNEGSACVAPHVRDGQLYVCNQTQVNSSGEADVNGDRVGVRWFQFDLSGDPTGRHRYKERPDTVPAIVQVGTLYDDNPSTMEPLFYNIPAIMTNKNHDLVIGGTISSAGTYTNVFYAGRKAKDPKGTLRDTVLLTDGQFPYNFGPLAELNSGILLGQRWGDQSSISPDPTNDLDIWLTGEFAAVQNGWGIQSTQLKPTPSRSSCNQ